MTRSVRIHVLDIDIAKGKIDNCYACPIAVSVNRHLRERLQAEVSDGVIGIVEGKGLPYTVASARAPKVVREFVYRFDRVSEPNPRPFFFDIELPVAVLS